MNHSISGYQVQRAAQKIDKAMMDLENEVEDLRKLLSVSDHVAGESTHRGLQVLSTIAQGMKGGAETLARHKVRAYLEDIPFDNVQREGKTMMFNLASTEMPRLVTIYRILQVEKQETDARREDMTFCEVCNKAVKNLKSHSKSQSHRGRVRIRELQSTGWVKAKATGNNQLWSVFSANIKEPDFPSTKRLTSFNNNIDPKIFGFRDLAEMEEEWRMQSATLSKKYSDMICTQAYAYNRNGSVNRYEGSLWVKDSISNYGEALADSCKREDRAMNSMNYRKRMEDPVAEKARFQRRKAWRASIDALLSNPVKIKLWATMQALKG